MSDPLDAEECVNDAYLGLWNCIPPQRPRSLRAFLGRIVRNLSLNRCDYERAARRNREFDILLSELGDCVSGESSPGDSGAIADLLNTFLAGLLPKDRQLFVRRYWYLDSIAQLAELFSLGENAVKSRLFRLRSKLRRQLEKEGFTL